MPTSEYLVSFTHPLRPQTLPPLSTCTNHIRMSEMCIGLWCFSLFLINQPTSPNPGHLDHHQTNLASLSTSSDLAKQNVTSRFFCHRYPNVIIPTTGGKVFVTDWGERQCRNHIGRVGDITRSMKEGG